MKKKNETNGSIDAAKTCRSAGILLHISSLPGRYGVGTLGKEARAFVDFLCESGVKYWQVLPLVQTGYGDSPYQSVYSGSGNPYFIDLESLAADGLLKKKELAECRGEGNRVDYDFLYAHKYAVLRKAFTRFDTGSEEFSEFLNKGGMHEYALFMAIKTKSGGASFDRWEKKLKRRDPAALGAFLAENRREYLFWQFLQYEFFRQWRALRTYANGRGVRIVGDIPLYVAYDSADVWASPSLFKLNKNLTHRKVAGVPPDYFSATGQLWGNPVYDWKKHEAQGYRWWIERIRHAFTLYDAVRIDHFRGFDRYFEIDAGQETAVNGRWRHGPGEALFAAVRRELGETEFIAEDLGASDAGVVRLMRRTGFPGMKILEFAFDGNPDNPYLPKNIGENSICYTGTHDNDTLVGFFEKMPEWEFENFKRLLKPVLRESEVSARIMGVKNTAKAMRLLAWSVRSSLAVVPMQDILLLGGESRMNVPAVGQGNWQFRLNRLPPRSLAKQLAAELKRFGRS